MAKSSGSGPTEPVDPFLNPGRIPPPPPGMVPPPGAPMPDMGGDRPPQYAQPPVGQSAQPQYAQAPAPQYAQGAQQYSPGYAVSKPNSWMNIVALVTGLLCFGPVAIIFGHLGVRAANRGEADYKGLGIAGLVLGYIGLVFVLAYFGLIAIAIASDPGYSY